MSLATPWAQSLGLAGLGLLLALVLLLAGVPGRPADHAVGRGSGAELRLRAVEMAGPGGGRPWRLRVQDLVVQRRVRVVFGIAGDLEMVLRGTEARLPHASALPGLVREAGVVLWGRWPGIPVRFEGLSLTVGPERGAWTLHCAAAEFQRQREMLHLQDVRVREVGGREWRAASGIVDLRSGSLRFPNAPEGGGIAPGS